MTIEVTLPALHVTQWIGGIVLSLIAFGMGTIGMLLVVHREQMEDWIIGGVLFGMSLVMLFAVLNILEVITLVFK